MNKWQLDIGANVVDNSHVRFKVWAPKSEAISVRIISGSSTKDVSMERDALGYFTGMAEDTHHGDLYLYLLSNNIERPDPASRYQPRGVHSPSQVVDPAGFQWDDNNWKGMSLKDYIIYELHVGTFSGEGTFDSLITRLDYLRDLGISAIELMPVAQFPGGRNWGYDGVYPFAPQNTYGGPDGLKRLINACHRKGLAVILDVVYNHLGPEGNYLNDFGYYFTDKYKTPWGEAINFDGPYSDEVRHYFISNALYWVTEYHIDALRIDAIHGIFDFSARHFLDELGEAVHREAETQGRQVFVIPESDLNDVRVINPREIGGYGLDAQWNDDFHHALHTLITGESKGYYKDFGETAHLERALSEGFVYSGQYSEFRKRRHGSYSKNRPAHQFIVFSQNHDQVGNRMSGDRLSQTQSYEQLKLAAGVVILSANIPLLFMGEEYGETAPFQYFVSHSDEELINAVRKGRREEFAAFEWEGEVPEPQAEKTFLSSKLNPGLLQETKHYTLLKFYRRLTGLRKKIPALSNLIKENMEVRSFSEEKVISVERWFEGDRTLCIFNFNDKDVKISLTVSTGIWTKLIDSSSREWLGPESPYEQRVELFSPELSVNLRPHGFIIYRMS